MGPADVRHRRGHALVLHRHDRGRLLRRRHLRLHRAPEDLPHLHRHILVFLGAERLYGQLPRLRHRPLHDRLRRFLPHGLLTGLHRRNGPRRITRQVAEPRGRRGFLRRAGHRRHVPRNHPPRRGSVALHLLLRRRRPHRLLRRPALPQGIPPLARGPRQAGRSGTGRL